MANNKLNVFKAVKRIIEDQIKPLTVKTAGTKREELDKSLNQKTGYWEDLSVVNKPPRWIVHFKKTGNNFFADFAKQTNGSLLSGANTVGYVNNREGNCSVMIFRILAAVYTPSGNYTFPDWEWLMILSFNRPLPAGTSGEAITNFDLEDGSIVYSRKKYPIRLLGIVDLPTNTPEIPINDDIILSYGEATAALIKFLETGNSLTVRAFNNSEESLNRLGEAIKQFVSPKEDASTYDTIPYIEPKTDLYGIPDFVYTQIMSALKAGKRHLIFYGPPGTGKTTLAQHVAQELSRSGEYEILTASSSWTSQELIGGYQPIGGGKIGFVPGVILRNFDRPIVIDELNRCPIDKVLGPLFSVLSGQSSTLPYKSNLEDSNSPFHVIFPGTKEDPAPHEWFPGPDWRLIATLNTVDKSQLGQISYALSRRFAWIKIGVPDNLHEFTLKILNRKEVEKGPNLVASMWSAVNQIRPIGGAPIIDFIRTIQEIDPNLDLFAYPDPEAQYKLLAVLSMYILPLLDGIRKNEGDNFIEEICQSWRLNVENRNILISEVNDILA